MKTYTIMECAILLDMNFFDFITMLCTYGLGSMRKGCFVAYRKYSKYCKTRKPYFIIKHITTNSKMTFITEDGFKYIKSIL